jgi:hypothetical protein
MTGAMLNCSTEHEYSSCSYGLYELLVAHKVTSLHAEHSLLNLLIIVKESMTNMFWAQAK